MGYLKHALITFASFSYASQNTNTETFSYPSFIMRFMGANLLLSPLHYSAYKNYMHVMGPTTFNKNELVLMGKKVKLEVNQMRGIRIFQTLPFFFAT